MNPHVVEAESLVKRFGKVTAVSDVTFHVSAGEIFGLIGPDGAGKTTLLRMLATLLVPSQGQARVLGHDIVTDLWVLRPKLGYMASRFSLYPDLSVEENLAFFAAVFGTSIAAERERIAPIYLQLEPFRERRAGALSGGMKQKLALCCALVHRPELLLLDEPTTGVDAVSRREFWDLLRSLKSQGLTIVVSTPYMDEANRCDKIALMQEGKILIAGTPVSVARSFPSPLFALTAADRYRTLVALRKFSHTGSISLFGETLHYADSRDLPLEPLRDELNAFLAQQGLGPVTVRSIDPGIEDVFMERAGA